MEAETLSSFFSIWIPFNLFFLKQRCIKVLEKFEFWEGAQNITMQKVKVKHLHSTFRKHFCESLFKGYVEEKKISIWNTPGNHKNTWVS